MTVPKINIANSFSFKNVCSQFNITMHCWRYCNWFSIVPSSCPPPCWYSCFYFSQVGWERGCAFLFSDLSRKDQSKQILARYCPKYKIYFTWPSCTYTAVTLQYFFSVLLAVGALYLRSETLHYVINTFVSFSDCKLITVLSRKRSSLNCFSQVKLQRATVMTIRKHCFLRFNRDEVTNLRQFGVGKGLSTPLQVKMVLVQKVKKWKGCPSF